MRSTRMEGVTELLTVSTRWQSPNVARTTTTLQGVVTLNGSDGCRLTKASNYEVTLMHGLQESRYKGCDDPVSWIYGH